MHFSPACTRARRRSLGFGTLDALFEVLTLIQTRKVSDIIVVLVGPAFWQRLINWALLVEEGLISPQDLNLFHFAETAAEAWAIVSRFRANRWSLRTRRLMRPCDLAQHFSLLRTPDTLLSIRRDGATKGDWPLSWRPWCELCWDLASMNNRT
jgi:hypothetical protein